MVVVKGESTQHLKGLHLITKDLDCSFFFKHFAANFFPPKWGVA